MGEKIQFDLVSPERLLLSMEVDAVNVPGIEGDFCVLPKHAPFMSLLRPGVISVTVSEKSMMYFVYGGFADVTPEGITILAERVLDDITKENIASEMNSLRQTLSDMEDESEQKILTSIIESLEDMSQTL